MNHEYVYIWNVQKGRLTITIQLLGWHICQNGFMFHQPQTCRVELLRWASINLVYNKQSVSNCVYTHPLRQKLIRSFKTCPTWKKGNPWKSYSKHHSDGFQQFHSKNPQEISSSKPYLPLLPPCRVLQWGVAPRSEVAVGMLDVKWDSSMAGCFVERLISYWEHLHIWVSTAKIGVFTPPQIIH